MTGRRDRKVSRPKRTRAECVRSAIASTEMEGQTVPPETLQLLNQWAEGQLTNKQLLAASAQRLRRQTQKA